ncbi:NUDIX domain-containing protein [Actinophytocola sediminis]
MAQSAAGALFLDGTGRVLIVEPTYKDHWEIPGGMLEAGETPSQACVREIAEELGLTVRLGRLLVADWAPDPTLGDRVLFVFDGGTLSPAQLAGISLPAAELASYALIAQAEVESRLIPRLARRVRAALTARAEGTTSYLEHGIPF